MSHVDRQYKKLCQRVLLKGHKYKDVSRDNVGMLEIPHYLLDIDMTQGFPLLTTKKINWKICAHELIWMLSGSTNIDYLQKNNIRIWDEDAHNFSGGSYVGPIYGSQWRSWNSRKKEGFKAGLDQIQGLIEGLRANRFDRRRLVTAWNPSEVRPDEVALPPCHWAFQVMPDGYGFALKWHQRSTDVFLGLPFDIALYAFLGSLISRIIEVPFTRLIGDLSCVHFYEPHLPLVYSQLRHKTYMEAPKLVLSDYVSSLDDVSIEHFKIVNYESYPSLRAPLITKSYKNENN